MIWPFLLFFMRMTRNGNSLQLCSILNFIMGCRFWSNLCNSLMFPHGNFQNIKQSSKYLFHNLVAVPDLFPLANQCPSPSKSATHWPIRGRAHWFFLPLRTIFSSPFCKSREGKKKDLSPVLSYGHSTWKIFTEEHAATSYKLKNQHTNRWH